MRVAIFGGSFDPVHQQHIEYAKSVIRELNLDELIIMPTYSAPHKNNGAWASGKDRFTLCSIAFSKVDRVCVSDFEIRQEGTSYTYLTAQWFARQYPSAERFFLVGKDMLENFYAWKNPEEILKNVTLVACGRGEEIHEEEHQRFKSRFGVDFLEMSFVGKELSSTQIRTELYFWATPTGLDEEVYEYILQNNLYTHPAVLPALALQRQIRRQHSFRVGKMAVARAKSLKISPRKALLAAALHDCGKYVPLDSPMLETFIPPENVPEPVMHQFIGAYLAEERFHVEDEEVLDAIRYHTSAKEDMSALCKLIYLADLLEEKRVFQGVERLRELFWQDLDECFFESLREQIAYLKGTGKPVYNLTQKAFEWELRRKSEK